MVAIEDLERVKAHSGEGGAPQPALDVRGIHVQHVEIADVSHSRVVYLDDRAAAIGLGRTRLGEDLRREDPGPRERRRACGERENIEMAPAEVARRDLIAD